MPKSDPQDRHVIELSTGQLVAGICALLVFALFCILAGILLARIEMAFHTPQSQPINVAAAPGENRQGGLPHPTTSPQKPNQPVGQQVSPRRDFPPVPGAGSEGVSPSSPGAPGSAKRDLGQPRVVDLRPLDTTQGKAPSTPETTPPETAKEPGPAAGPSTESLEGAAHAAIPQEAQKPSPAPAGKDGKPGKQPAEETMVASGTPHAGLTPIEPAEQPMETRKPPTAAGSGQHLYAVQVAAVSIGERKQAEHLAEEVEKITGLAAEVVTSEDGKWLRVLVGSYPDRENATKAQAELRKQARFADCFVQKRQQP